jgi:transcriptional regulator with GAF, ATPase, and Fis domain
MPIESKTDNHTTIEALLNISLAVQEMNKPADLSKVMQTCLSELHKLNIPADAMAVHQIIDAEQGTLKTHRVWQNKVIGDTIEPGRHGLVRRWKEGCTFYEKDLNARGGGYPEAFRKRFEDFHLMSFVDIPFAQGILTLQSLQKQAFPEHIQVLFRDVAILFAIGLVRLEDLETVESQNKALQESEQKVRKLNEELEQRIKTRTKDLQTANQNLQNEIAIRQSAEKDLHQSNMLLEGLRHAQTQYIEKVDTKTLFEELLQDLLNLTQSEYGFIGEVLHTPKNEPYLKTHAITNIAWNDETRAFYEENAPQGLEFVNLKSLFGSVMTTEKPVIANSPATDPRRTGIPEGHPPLDAFLGIPFFSANNIVGMVGIANRKQGYDQPIIDFLAPFLVTCGAIIEAQQNEQRREQAEESLAQSEEKLRQSQKMEAIGKLAGGVAHDFNNLLTVINGYSKILLDVLQTTDPNREFIEEIQKAGNRASALTNQLLIFSRRQVIQPEVVDLNQVTTDLQKMWSRLIGENIDLKLRLHARSSFVEADPGQLEQVILNIVINARDAMPQGGSLTIELSTPTSRPTRPSNGVIFNPVPMFYFRYTTRAKA